MKLENKVNEMEVLATFTHGTLFAFHSLGFVYNLRKKNYIDATIHALTGIYDLGSTIKHYKDIKNGKE